MDSKSFLTPVCQRVCKSLSNPLGIVSSVVLLLSALLLFALDFSAGITVLPLAALELVAVSVTGFKAKRGNKKFGLPFLKISAFFGLAVFSAVFTLLTLNSFLSLFKVIKPFETVPFVGLPSPFNMLNSGFLRLEALALPLALLLLSKGIFACTLNGCVRKNLPKSGGLFASIIILILSLATSVYDGLCRAQIIPSGYAYCRPELQNVLAMYISTAVLGLAAAATVLEIIKVINTYVKLRK